MFFSHLSLRSHTFRLCLFALAFAPPLVEAVAISRGATGNAGVLSLVARDDGCTTPGNSDLYGLGIRLGVYWQWVTCFLANRYVADEISSSLDANAIFLLALLISMLHTTLESGIENGQTVSGITLIDGLILLELCFGYLFSVLSLFGYRTRLFGKAYISIFGTYIRLFLAGAISGYSVWFWFKGAVHLTPGQCGPPVMFFFSKVHVLGWIKYLWRVLACLCALYFCSVFAGGVFTFLAWVGALAYSVTVSGTGFRSEWDHFWDVARTTVVADPPEAVDKRKARRAYNVLSIINFLFIPWSIVSIELTINWNHLTGVTGTAALKGAGQLIPALIGTGGFLRIVWIMIINEMNKRQKARAANPPSGAKTESHRKRPKISPAVHKARNMAFQLNAQLLVYILSFAFITSVVKKVVKRKPKEKTNGDEPAKASGNTDVESTAAPADAIKSTDETTTAIGLSEKPSPGDDIASA